MTNAKLQQAADIALKVCDKTATEGEKMALQMFMVMLTKREERAFEKVLNAALSKQVAQRQHSEWMAARKAELAKWR